VGGFIAAESVWRQRNEVADIASNFGAIPTVLAALQREGISWQRPAKPDLAARRGEYRSVPEAQRVL
jgi:hypothetical protein